VASHLRSVTLVDYNFGLGFAVLNRQASSQGVRLKEQTISAFYKKYQNEASFLLKLVLLPLYFFSYL
jgi:hypothetical protein